VSREKSIVVVYVLSIPIRLVNNFVPFPTHKIMSPLAIGSSVQLCPTLSLKCVLMILTTSKLEIQLGLLQATSIGSGKI
jgi:hypothetical protein